MTEIVFSFDTEDFTSSTAADSIMEEANILRENGIKGNFVIVGLLAWQLKNWKRQDVIDALSYHEIGLHSYGHTLHPTINEYTDIEDFDEAYREVIKQESEAVRLIKETFGKDVKLYAACPPGNQKNYVAMYAYSDMGIPIYADTICDTDNGDGTYYCNAYQMKYTFMIENLMLNGDEKAMREALDDLATKKRAVIFTHPNNVLFDEAWDEQFYKINHTEFGKWREMHRRPVEDSLRFYENFRKFVKMIKDDPRFSITTYSEVAKRLEKEPERVVTLSHIPAIKSEIDKELYPIKTPLNLSLSDIFLACRDLLLGEKSHTCRKVKGLLSKPYAISAPLTLSRTELETAARSINPNGFIPEKIKVKNKEIGPADFIRAALAVLSGEDAVTLSPAPAMPSFRAFPRLETISFKGGWMQSDEFMDNFIADRLRLQIYTMRFPEV